VRREWPAACQAHPSRMAGDVGRCPRERASAVTKNPRGDLSARPSSVHDRPRASGARLCRRRRAGRCRAQRDCAGGCGGRGRAGRIARAVLQQLAEEVALAHHARVQVLAPRGLSCVLAPAAVRTKLSSGQGRVVKTLPTPPSCRPCPCILRSPPLHEACSCLGLLPLPYTTPRLKPWCPQFAATSSCPRLVRRHSAAARKPRSSEACRALASSASLCGARYQAG